jgi:hypothetical protein
MLLSQLSIPNHLTHMHILKIQTPSDSHHRK